jgi:squalene-hopene/tetraprenyl-beta-curcumene cyclase
MANHSRRELRIALIWNSIRKGNIAVRRSTTPMAKLIRVGPTGLRVATSGLLMLLAACTRPAGLAWDAPAAAEYMDKRAVQWMNWPKAARAHETVCISCHTALTYALAREPLGRVLNEPELPAPRRQLLANVVKRVQMWPQLPPYYQDKAIASRGTESVLNALILADEDARQGHLSAATLAAFDDMWALQQTSGVEAGSWAWIQFGSEPWEAYDSGYYGATLAALAVGVAPEDYRLRPSVQEGLARLRDYLARTYANQTLLNRIDLLWAAGQLPELIEPRERDDIVREIWALQRSDGGWSLPSLMPHWKRKDGKSPANRSDGYATGLITLVLQESGVSLADTRLRRGLSWLEGHQSMWNGRWMTDSPNRVHGWRDESRHFMDDAATAFAVLALVKAQPTAAAATGGSL